MSDTVSAKSVSAKAVRSPRWYGRIPASVILDSSISSEAVRVYGFLSLDVYQGNIARVGMRLIGRLLDMSPMTVKRRIDELAHAGHIERHPIKNGHRAYYMLTSPVFAQKQRAGTKEVVSCPRGHRRMVSIPDEEIA